MLLPSKPLLEAVRADVPEDLVNEHAWSRILPLAGRLPAAASIHYLECRLAATDSRVDYQFGARLSEGGPVLARAVVAGGLGDPWCSGDGWRRIQEFFTHWTNPMEAIHGFVPVSGLEFDLDDSQETLVPQVLFCVVPGFGGELSDGVAPPPDSERFHVALARALTVIRGSSPTAPSRRIIGRCTGRLPSGGRILHIIALVGRPGGAIRIGPEVPADALLSYLVDIGWPGSVATAQRVLDLLEPEGSVKVDVDIRDDQIVAKFGVFSEYTLGAARDGREDYQHAGPFLDRLVAIGLCSREKRDALLRLKTRTEAAVDGLGWPVAVRRHLDFKVVATPDGTMEAKAYLGFEPEFSLL